MRRDEASLQKAGVEADNKIKNNVTITEQIRCYACLTFNPQPPTRYLSLVGLFSHCVCVVWILLKSHNWPTFLVQQGQQVLQFQHKSVFKCMQACVCNHIC